MIGSNGFIMIFMVADLCVQAAGFQQAAFLFRHHRTQHQHGTIILQVPLAASGSGLVGSGSASGSGALYLSNDDNNDNDSIIPALLKTNEKGETYFELSPDRRFTICKWQGETRVDIREFYEKEGKMLPGKKGLSLTMDQLKIVKDFIQDGTVDDMIREMES